MNAQTQSTPEEMLGYEPGTPVIVKMGGNPIGSPICIASDDLPFDSIEKRWQGAESISGGRICELKVNDGALPDQICTISSRPEVLASLEVYRVTDGMKLFDVSEVNVNGSLRLMVSSKIYFRVMGEQPARAWKQSETEEAFLPKDVKIVFKQTNTRTQKVEMSLEYTFSSSDEISVTIFFPPPISD